MGNRIFVLGATGRTGSHIVDLALQRGHRVTAYVRSPAKLSRRARVLEVVQGDVRDVDRLATAMHGHDAVLSALGPSVRQALRPSTLMAEFAAAIVAAMTRAGVERIAVVSAAVLSPGRGPAFAFFRWFLRHHAEDLQAMETVIRAAPLDWTVARPPRLVASSEESYRIDLQPFVTGASAMSFRAVAAFLLDATRLRQYSRAVVGLERGPAGNGAQ